VTDESSFSEAFWQAGFRLGCATFTNGVGDPPASPDLVALGYACFDGS
jgi:hypothetical protein